MTNDQGPMTNKAPMSNDQEHHRPWSLVIGHWSFVGHWDLVIHVRTASDTGLRVAQPRPHDFGHPGWLRLEPDLQIEIERVIIALQVHMLTAERRQERFDHPAGDPLFAELALRPDIQ